jgi:chaperonin GroEL
MLLTTECVISNIKEENSGAPMPPMGGAGMPGMM